MSRLGNTCAVALLGGIALAGCKPGIATEQSPADNPELYGVLSRGLHGPMRYQGGNQDTCGAWAANDPADARELAAECPPLRKGDLP